LIHAEDDGAVEQALFDFKGLKTMFQQLTNNFGASIKTRTFGDYIADYDEIFGEKLMKLIEGFGKFDEV